MPFFSSISETRNRKLGNRIILIIRFVFGLQLEGSASRRWVRGRDESFDISVCALLFWLMFWHFGLHFNILACTLTFWLALWRFCSCFAVLAYPLMFRLAYWCFGSHLDVSACIKHFGSRFKVLAALWHFGRALMFHLALWHFGSRFDILARAWTFWLALWHFGSRFNVWLGKGLQNLVPVLRLNSRPDIWRVSTRGNRIWKKKCQNILGSCPTLALNAHF